MKPFFVILSILFFSFGCIDSQKNEKNKVFNTQEDALQEITDSIRYYGTYQNIIDSLKILINETNEDIHYQSDTLDVLYGHIFSSKEKHLFVKWVLSEPQYSYRGIWAAYQKSSQNLDEVFKKEIELKNYDGYTLYDINKNGLVDIIFQMHPSSGSCNCYEVYLFEEDGSGFKEDYHMDDFSEKAYALTLPYPYFYIEEKTVIVIVKGTYGDFYEKNKWNNSNGLDPIEAIHFADYDFPEPFVDSLGSEYFKKMDYKTQKETIIYKLPKEYDLPFRFAYDSIMVDLLKIRP